MAITTASDAAEDWKRADAMRPADREEAAYRNELRRKALRPVIVLAVLGALWASWGIVADLLE